MKQWFVVQTNPKEEEIACMVLRQSGIEVYQPWMQKYVYHARKKTLKRYPLFPNYIFVQVAPNEEDLHKIRWCRGVRRILLDNYQPVPIDEDFIVSLHSLEDEGSGIIKKPVDFMPGDVVRIKSGPMKDLYGVFEAWGSDEGRVRILIEMVNNRAKVVMHSSLIEKA
ncbi:MAG TPA: transcription termination/antitermination NusG family protein [Deltaproteobacteria bacterium]|nr:transcription termination/antitermination NusG family protein [Deltaproteobacteria bacterium]HPJ93869.1 transcription termination/antitermination NusG family protein [Deltaproteobacteria bacterium]HPR51841.1 transcription termination/antitermination NusG family protein [Deltaproteobacteria bacterium]